MLNRRKHRYLRILYMDFIDFLDRFVIGSKPTRAATDPKRGPETLRKWDP